MKWIDTSCAGSNMKEWTLEVCAGLKLRVTNWKCEGWIVGVYGRKNFGDDIEAAKRKAIKDGVKKALAQASILTAAAATLQGML